MFRNYFIVLFGFGGSVGILFEGIIVEVLVVGLFDEFYVKVFEVYGILYILMYFIN